MRTSIFAALMAAASLIPGAAIAQRGQDRNGPDRAPRGVTIESRLGVGQDRGDRGPDEDRPQPQQRADRDGGGARFDRGNGDDDGRRGPDRARPAPAPAPAAQIERSDRGDFRGNDGRQAGDRRWRGSDNRGNTAQWRGNDNRNDQWRNQGRNDQWRGNDRRQDARGDRGNWNRGWRQDNRYDWNRRRQYDRSAFHLPRYYAPSGWGYGYRRFNVGITLNAGLFGRNYWIDDAYDYGLPQAYGPYRWVRYYNDALLVDVYSGQVVDTVYDIFW